MKRNKLKSRITFCFPIILGLFFLGYGNITSHPTLNKLIVDAFVSKNNKGEFSMYKFQNYVFSLNRSKLKGDYITSPGLFNPSEVGSVGDISVKGFSTTYTEKSMEVSPQEWIEHGGFSADVPEVPASLRHFYDPTRAEGECYLTDQVNSELFAWAQSFMKNPNTDGVEWAIGTEGDFGVTEHFYTWQHGKKYMISALEEPDAKKRNNYMARAWRSLGETLHMIADNGCPAHVRNDGHPSLPLPVFSYFGDPDPYEEQMAVSSISVYDGGAVSEDLKDSFREAKTVQDIAHELAVFTNKNFFSNETISGTDWKGNPVIPTAHPDYVYDSPKLSASAYENYYYYKTINEVKVKMCTDMQFFQGYSVYRTDPYIDDKCVESQAKVLVPTIKEAGLNVMKLFIPELKVEITNMDEDGTISGKVTHKTDKEYTEQIQYNGPVLIKNIVLETLATLHAKNGVFTGKMGSSKNEIFAEIEFGGVAIRSKQIKSNVSAFGLGHKSSKTPEEMPWPSSDGFNDPLKQLLLMRDVNFVVSEEGNFHVLIPGHTIRKSYNERKGFSINNGIQLSLGNVSLNGQIEDMKRVFDYIEKKGSSSGFKVGTMKYSSNGSYSDKEELYAGSDKTQTNRDYSFTVSAEYDLYVKMDTRRMAAPVVISAQLREGSERYSGLPDRMGKGVEDEIIFEINKN